MKSEIKKNLSIFNGFYEFRPIHDILVSPNELTNDDVSVINDTLDKIENIVKNLRNSMFTYEVNALAWFRETFENGIPGTEPEPPVLYKFTVPTNAKYTITPASGIIETVEGGEVSATLTLVDKTEVFTEVTVVGLVDANIDFVTDPTKCTITGKMPENDVTVTVKITKPEPPKYKLTIPTNAKYTIIPASGIIETVEGGDITASLAIVGDTDIFESVTVTGIVGGKIDFTTDPAKCTIIGKMPGKNITADVKVKVKPEPEPEP